MLGLGFYVGGKRQEFADRGAAAGDADAEKRFKAPQLYAEGLSDTAIAFNCLQRGHQQAMETLPQFMTMSIIGGFTFPLTVSIFGMLWNIGRVQWALGYEQSAGERYKGGPLTFFIWVALVVNMFACVLVATDMLFGVGLPLIDVAGKIRSLF